VRLATRAELMRVDQQTGQSAAQHGIRAATSPAAKAGDPAAGLVGL